MPEANLSAFRKEGETLDRLFDGRLKVLQPAKGYRFSVDALLLAAFFQERQADHVLEIGPGSGIISLILALRTDTLHLTGIEIQEDLADLARLHEERLHIAWHALSLWWFCRLDGRGPYSLRENLAAQFEALQTIAASGKPYEPNVAHHFAFRGADDVTALAATVLAARTAKRLGIRRLVLQVMLNTPRSTWGIQDIAKARALLALVRPLEDDRFQVILQPRGGLDFFSPDPQKAKAQLAAVTALMDDIEPRDTRSPPLIHVVSYSEGYALADPPVIAESLQIVRAALDAYRDLRRRGMIDDMTDHPETVSRTARLQNETLARLAAMEAAIPDLLSEAGLYQAFAQGFLHTPYLWEGRDELAPAVRARTRLSHGGVILEPEPPRTPS